MPDVENIVKGAIKRLVPDSTNDPSAERIEDGLEALNEMMLAYPSMGIDVDWSTKTLGDNFPLDDRHIQGVKALLAKRLAADFGIYNIPKQLDVDAQKGDTALYADYMNPGKLKAPNELLRFSANGRVNGIYTG